MSDKKADLAGPGIGNYDDLAKILPNGYEALLPFLQSKRSVRRYSSQPVSREQIKAVSVIVEPLV